MSSEEPSNLPLEFEPFVARLALVQRDWKLDAASARDRLEVLRDEAGLHVAFHFDNPGLDALGDLFVTLTSPGVAEALVSLRLTGEDIGGNGTRAIDLADLADMAGGARTLPALRTLEVEQTQPGHHNQTIVVGRSPYEENGVVGRLVARTPELRELILPSAPDRSFFATAPPALRSLNVAAGYDHQGFILHLTESDGLTALERLRFVDYTQPYMSPAEQDDGRVPAAHYARLADTKGLPGLRRLELVNAVGAGELFQGSGLTARNVDLQFLSTVVGPHLLTQARCDED